MKADSLFEGAANEGEAFDIEKWREQYLEFSKEDVHDMESKHKILLNNIPTQIKDAFALPKEKQRVLWYTGKLPHKTLWTIVSYSESDEKLIYSETDVTAKMAGHIYPQRVAKKGFTLDKQTKKLRMWYLSQPTNLRYLHLLLREIGKEWVINEQFTGTEYYTDRTGVTTTMGSWLTKGLLEKILLNKITNPSDAAKYIIKANRLKGASPKFLQQYIKNKKPKFTLLMHNGYVTNINAVLQGANAVDSYTTGDLLKQAKALGRQIDLGWSRNRKEEVHKQWTRELMEIELSLLEEEIVEYKEDFSFLPPQIELIRDRKRLFVEGKNMDHCVYTNYWELVKSRHYMVWHVLQEDGEPVTAGISISSHGFKLEQVFGKRNQVLPTESTKRLITSVLYDPRFIDTMNKEFNIQTHNKSNQPLLFTPHGDPVF